MRISGTVAATAAIVATLSAGAAAAAHFARPDDAVRYRQAVYALMGHHTERIGDMASGARPFDAAQAQASASIVEMLSKLPIQAFEPGMQTRESRARDAVWTRNAEFRALAAQMREAVATLSAVSRSGDRQRVRAAFGDAAKACKACHDEFKKP